LNFLNLRARGVWCGLIMKEPPPSELEQPPANAAEFQESFEEVKELGRGRFGTAFLVKHRVTSCRYCLKRTQFGTAKGQMTEEKVAMESSALERLHHPNIIRWFAMFTETRDDGPTMMCILMEYANGGDLAALLARRWWDATRNGQHQLSETQLMDWFVQLVAGLAYAHSKRVLHRDLKPENVFVTLDGSCKIGDFGISRVLETSGDLAQTAVGSPVYLSPEIVKGAQYDYRSDVWSLGVTLYKMATNSFPFEASNLAQLALKIAAGSYPPLPPGYSPNLHHLVAVMLQIDPERRADMGGVSDHPFVRENVARRATSAASTLATSGSQLDRLAKRDRGDFLEVLAVVESKDVAKAAPTAASSAPGTAPIASNGAAAAATRAPSPTIPRSGSASRIPAPPRRKSTTPRPPDDNGEPKGDGGKHAVTGASTGGGLEPTPITAPSPPPLRPPPLAPSAAEAAATTTGATRPSPRRAALKPLRPPPVSAPLAATSPGAATDHGSEGSASSSHTPPSVPALTGAGPVTAPASKSRVQSNWVAARNVLDLPKGSQSARPKLQTPGSRFAHVAQAAAEAAKKEKARPQTARGARETARLSAGQPSGSAKRPAVSTSGAKTAPKPAKTAPPKTAPAATPLPTALQSLPRSGMSPTAVAPAAKAAAFTADSELQRTLPPPPPPEAPAAGAVAGADASVHLPWLGLGAGGLAVPPQLISNRSLDNASVSTDGAGSGAGSTASPGTCSVVSPGSVPPLTPLTPGTLFEKEYIRRS
jgi:NIMA (never in mitosis gene a)-related kinase 1/4/5